VSIEHLEALRAARDSGLKNLDHIAEKFAPVDDDGESLEIARKYLNESVSYTLDDQARAGLKKFFSDAADVQVTQSTGAIRYFE